MQQQQSSDQHVRERQTVSLHPADQCLRTRAEDMLRDIAFVLNAAQRVKEAVFSDGDGETRL
jgi:hypothetical protein